MNNHENMPAIALTKHNEQQLAVDSNLDDLTKEYIQASLSDSTRRAYQHDWKVFVEWCASKNVSALPASAATVANFLSSQSKTYAKNKNGTFAKRNGEPVFLSVSTLERRLAAIKLRHESAHLESPTADKIVQATLRGLKSKSQTPIKKKEPLTAEHIENLIAQCDDSPTGLRDKALLLIGFAGAFRRSELVALTVDDIERTPVGIKVTIRKSKTDQIGMGATIGIPNHPRFRVVDALTAWLEKANIVDGYLFRPISRWGTIKQTGLTGKSVGCIVKYYANKAGLNVADFGAHSLRSGFLTSSAASGASIFKMMEQSRHKSVETLAGYIRSENLFSEHAGDKFL